MLHLALLGPGTLLLRNSNHFGRFDERFAGLHGALVPDEAESAGFAQTE